MNLQEVFSNKLKLARIKQDPRFKDLNFDRMMQMAEEVQRKIILDPIDLGILVREKKQLRQIISCTIGTWDLTHEGHFRYIAKAKSEGDALVLGIDTDAAVKRHKHPSRPYYDQYRRAELCGFAGSVNYITFVDDVDEKGIWGYDLIKEIRPDVFTIIAESYPPEQVRDIEFLCGRVNLIPRQAPGSTTNIVEEITAGLLGYEDQVIELKETNPKLVEIVLEAANILSTHKPKPRKKVKS